MGKATERRKKRRLQHLLALKDVNAEAFKMEVDKRIASWTNEIWEVAERGIIKGMRTFAIAQRAKGLITEAEQPVTEILEHECCKAVSVKQGMNQHRLVSAYGLPGINTETE